MRGLYTTSRRLLSRFNKTRAHWLPQEPELTYTTAQPVTKETTNLYELLDSDTERHLCDAKHRNEIRFHTAKLRHILKTPTTAAAEQRQLVLRVYGLRDDYFNHKDVITFGCGVFDIFHDLPVERSVCVDPTFEEVNNLTTFSTHFPRTDFHCASWEELPLPDSSFDVGFSHNVLDHVTNPDDCISESVRVLKRNALCYISVNLGLGRKPPNYKHPHRFSIESFEELLHRHMTILSITREGPYAWASLQNSGA